MSHSHAPIPPSHAGSSHGEPVSVSSDVPSLEEHLAPGPPKRILAIDGGGVRGALALSYLERIESVLRDRYRRPDLRLCDYYDLIGGTSTGAIIASGLACGYEVKELVAIYDHLGKRLFKSNIWPVFWPKYSGRRLGKILRQKLGDVELGSDKIRTGLVVVLKRLDTNSPWVLVNNPRARYFYSPPDRKHTVPNRQFKLWELVQASAAAPYYFPPVMMKISRHERGLFIDGGVSAYNNPALALLMVAGFKGFGLEWPIGPDRLLLTSVGTGAVIPKTVYREDHKVLSRIRLYRLRLRPPWWLAASALVGTIDDGDQLGRILLQWFSNSQAAEKIDRLIGDLRGELLAGRDLLTYGRYNVDLDLTTLKRDLNLVLKGRQARDLGKMDEARMIETYKLIGRAAANRQIDNNAFPPHFDPAFVRAGAPAARITS